VGFSNTTFGRATFGRGRFRRASIGSRSLDLAAFGCWSLSGIRCLGALAGYVFGVLGHYANGRLLLLYDDDLLFLGLVLCRLNGLGGLGFLSLFYERNSRFLLKLLRHSPSLFVHVIVFVLEA
jgi:hypothetical protein